MFPIQPSEPTHPRFSFQPHHMKHRNNPRSLTKPSRMPKILWSTNAPPDNCIRDPSPSPLSGFRHSGSWNPRDAAPYKPKEGCQHSDTGRCMYFGSRKTVWELGTPELRTPPPEHGIVIPCQETKQQQVERGVDTLGHQPKMFYLFKNHEILKIMHGPTYA